MKIRKVSDSVSSDLIVDSFVYGRAESIICIDTKDSYELCYIIGGGGTLKQNDDSVASIGGSEVFRANFADKTPSSAVFENGILKLANCMNLLFFTSPETGIYRITVDCTCIRNAPNCNIWYFKGCDEKGYSFIEIDGNENRHDPRLNVRQLFPVTIALEKGHSIVIGIGNYWGAELKIHEISANQIDSDTPCKYSYPESACFKMYDHPHASTSSHLEKSGDGFIFAPGSKCIMTADEGRYWTHFNIKIKGKNAEKVLSKNLIYDRLGCFSYSFSGKLTHLIPLLFFTDRPLSEIEASILLNDILALQSAGQSVRANPYVEKAKAYVMKNTEKPIKITEVAASIGISDRYLYNLFIKYEGISPKQYINNVKLEKAKKLLSSPNISVTEVAEAVGFADVLRFSHFFSDHAGLSPSKYRKTNAKK